MNERVNFRIIGQLTSLSMSKYWIILYYNVIVKTTRFNCFIVKILNL